MKKIIQGATYDTETATEIAEGSHNHESSQAWWRLYRTPAGAFFEVVAGHDGVVEEFRQLTRGQAYSFLETHANHLIEKYFGSMPEATPSKFSRSTAIAAVEVLETKLKHGALTRCLLKWSPKLNARCDAGGLDHRYNHLIKALDEEPDQRVEGGTLLSDALVEKAVSIVPPPEPLRPWREPTAPRPHIAAFMHALDRDGFTIVDGVLQRTLPVTLQLPEANDQVASLLKKHSFAVPKGHLDQAFANHADGNWAAANSQIRSFLESLLDEIAEKINPALKDTATGQARRSQLAKSGFLSQDLNEWQDDGKGYMNGLMKRLHPHGSHPGLSDQDDSTFRLHTVLLAARLLLVRYDGMGKA